MSVARKSQTPWRHGPASARITPGERKPSWLRRTRRPKIVKPRLSRRAGDDRAYSRPGLPPAWGPLPCLVSIRLDDTHALRLALGGEIKALQPIRDEDMDIADVADPHRRRPSQLLTVGDQDHPP